MKTFIEHLEEMKSAPYHKYLFLKLKAAQSKILNDLAIQFNAISDLHEREKKINRLFIDNLNPPKNHRIIIELLANANARCFFEEEKSKIKA